MRPSSDLSPGLRLEDTETERAELAFREGSDWINAVLQSAHIGTWVYDLGRERFRNDAIVARLYGLNEEEAAKLSLEDYLTTVHAGDRTRVAEEFGRAVVEGVRYDVEYRILVGERVRWVVARGFAEHDESGKVLRVRGAVVDVTPQRITRTRDQVRLSELLDNASAFTALMEGPDLTFTYVNREFRRLIGGREVVGLPLRKGLPELEGQGFYDGVDRVMTTGEPYSAKEQTLTLDRVSGDAPERRTVDLLYQAMRDADGAIYGVLAHGVDVTDGVRARKKAAQTEEMFRTVFEKASENAILLLGLDHRIQAWNPTAERICGWTEKEAVGQPYDLIFNAEDRAAGVPAAETAKAAQDGTAADERWRVGKNGARFWASGTIDALHDVDGTVRGYLKVFRDATERHEAETLVQELNDALEAKVLGRTGELATAVREAEGFDYSVSHDLRRPLLAISSTASVILDELGPTLSEAHRTLLRRQVHNVGFLGKLIDDLLRHSRLARVAMTREPLDVTALARGVAENVETPCGITVQEGMAAEGDAALVRTVFDHLLKNACKFSPGGGSIAVGQTDGAFWVRDEGIGFDMAYLPKIFQPFERLVTEAEFPGTGIGLANVRRIVERHGGRAWAESAPGKGATFLFTLG